MGREREREREIEREEMYTGFWWENLRETDYFEGSGVDWRIILRWIIRKWDRGHGTV